MKAFFYDDETLGAKYVEGEIPAEYLEQAKEYREKMIEAISDVDEKVMEKFLNGEDVTDDEIRAALRKGAIEMKLTPVICGTAFKNKGVQHLLDAIVDYLPCPYDIPPVIGISPDDNSEQLRKPEPKEPFSAFAFKIMTDPFVGQLTFLRVYSGTLNAGSYIYNSTKGTKERVGRLLQDACEQERRY